MLERTIMSERDRLRERRQRLDDAIKRARRESAHTRKQRLAVALYDDLIAVVDRHDSQQANTS